MFKKFSGMEELNIAYERMVALYNFNTLFKLDLKQWLSKFEFNIIILKLNINIINYKFYNKYVLIYKFMQNFNILKKHRKIVYPTSFGGKKWKVKRAICCFCSFHSL